MLARYSSLQTSTSRCDYRLHHCHQAQNQCLCYFGCELRTSTEPIGYTVLSTHLSFLHSSHLRAYFPGQFDVPCCDVGSPGSTLLLPTHDLYTDTSFPSCTLIVVTSLSIFLLSARTSLSKSLCRSALDKVLEIKRVQLRNHLAGS